MRRGKQKRQWGEATAAGAAKDGDIWNSVDQSLHVVWPPLYKCAASHTMTETGRAGRRTPREDRGEAGVTCVILEDHAQPHAFPPVRPTLFSHHALPRSPQIRRYHRPRRRRALATQPGVNPILPTHHSLVRVSRGVGLTVTHTSYQIGNAPLKVSVALYPMSYTRRSTSCGSSALIQGAGPGRSPTARKTRRRRRAPPRWRRSRMRTLPPRQSRWPSGK